MRHSFFFRQALITFMRPDSYGKTPMPAVMNFRIKEVNETDEWHMEPSKRTVEVERNEVCKAKLIWCWEHSKKMIGKTYFVIAHGNCIRSSR